jgi:hypothetical protein
MSRTILLLLVFINVVLAVAVYFFGHAGYGIAETVSFSRLRDLEVHHAVVINPDALRDIANAGLTNPSDVHPFLIEGFRGQLTIVDGAAVAFLFNAALWALAAWRSRRVQPAKTSPSNDRPSSRDVF